MAIQVPQYEDHVAMNPEAPAVPGPLESVAEAGLPGMKVAQAGNALTKVGLEVNKALDHARQVNDLAEMNLQAHLKLDQLNNQIQLDVGAPEKWRGNFEQQAAQIKEQVTGISADPAVQAAFNRQWSVIYPAKLQYLTGRSRLQDSKNFAAGFEEKYPQYVDMAAQAPDELNRTQIKDTLFNYINQGVAAGILDPQKAALARQNFDTRVRDAVFNQALAADAPGTVAALKTPGAFGFNDTERNSAMPAAYAAMHRIQADNALKVDQLYQSKQLTVPQLTQMRDSQQINIGTFRTYEAALTAPENQRDEALYGAMWVKANKGQLPDEEIYQALGAGKIRVPEAQNLQRTREAAQGGPTPDDLTFTKNPYFKLALQDIETRLKPIDNNIMARTQAMMGQVSPQALASHQAAYQLLQACQQAQKAGTLSGEFIQKKTAEIMQPFLLMGARTAINQPGGPGAAAPPGGTLPPPPGFETTVRDGKTYRVLTINGRKMVDPTPLP